jgi:glutathione peroxidase
MRIPRPSRKISIILIMLAFATLMFGIFNLFFGPKEGRMEPYQQNKMQNTEKTIYQFTMNDIDGKPVALSDYKGKVVIIVNVASKCGLTPQYKELQSFYDEYKTKGVVILGFPANNFMGQEPGSDSEIKSFCQKNYGVSFPVFSKISVKGSDMAPLYQFLTTKEKNGVMDSGVKWNFQKYLIDKEGRLVTFFDPRTEITDEQVIKAVNALL